jgi:hypothetical protein
VTRATSRKKKGRENPAQFRGKSVGTLGDLASGLPEWFGAFAAGFLRIKADVAQKMRVQMGQALAVAAADRGNGEKGKHTREKAVAAALGQGRDMGLGHFSLLRFVLIQNARFGRNNVMLPRNESPEDYCD